MKGFFVKLGITGSRTIKDFAFEELFNYQVAEFNSFLRGEGISAIISGGARGVDRSAEKCAGNFGIPSIVIRPDYARFQRGAPFKWNRQIIDECEALLVVWNGEPNSRGTIYTAVHALEAGKRVFALVVSGESYNIMGEIKSRNAFCVNRRPKQ